MLRSAARFVIVLLPFLLITSCSNTKESTVPDMPTFVPPGMIQDPLASVKVGTSVLHNQELCAVANYHFDVVLEDNRIGGEEFEVGSNLICRPGLWFLH